MIRIILAVIFCLFGLTVSAAKLDLSNVEDAASNKFNAPTQDNYNATKDSNFKGRNDGVIQLKTSGIISNDVGLSKVITSKTSKQSAQLDNLETNAGEMVQKIEDDRSRISNKQDHIYESSREDLSLARDYASKIELNHLGQELDPTVTNAFKCKDIEDCNHANDVRVINECAAGEMLHWDGDVWKCIGLFEVPDAPNCNQDQWMSTLPGGDKACVDYIYQWGYQLGTCTDGAKTDVAVCYRKKTANDTGSVIGDAKCYGPKPKNIVTECNSTWQIGGWGTCSKSCGGGVQYRSVTCLEGYKCPGAKPATSQSCNTQICTTSWTVGSWGACSKSCGGGTQTRSVTCRAGYQCPGAKPPTSQACNTQMCTTNWSVGGWGACSKGCGGGVQTRSVWCQSGYHCPAAKPATSQSCNTHSCPPNCGHCSAHSNKDNYLACVEKCKNPCPSNCYFGCCSGGYCASANGCG